MHHRTTTPSAAARQRAGVTLTLVLALGLGLGACSGNDVSTGPKTSGPGATSAPDGSAKPGPGVSLAEQIDGRTFILDAWPGAPTGAGAPTGSTGSTGAPGAPQPTSGGAGRIQFTKGKVSASVGCNGMSGPYSVDGDTLVVGEDLATTAMACDPPEKMERDAIFGQFLQSRPQVRLDGTTLTLAGAKLAFVFTDRTVADPDRPLVGTSWVVDGFIDGAGDTGTVSSGRAGTGRIQTLTFRTDGRYAARWGCNTGGGYYTVAGDRITIDGQSTTKMGCGAEGDALEAKMRAVVTGEVTFRIQASRLTLMNGEVGLSLRFEP